MRSLTCAVGPRSSTRASQAPPLPPWSVLTELRPPTLWLAPAVLLAFTTPLSAVYPLAWTPTCVAVTTSPPLLSLRSGLPAARQHEHRPSHAALWLPEALLHQRLLVTAPPPPSSSSAGGEGSPRQPCAFSGVLLLPPLPSPGTAAAPKACVRTSRPSCTLGVEMLRQPSCPEVLLHPPPSTHSAPE